MKNLKFTLKAWPVIALATIGLCFLTQLTAQLLGIDLPDQNQMKTVYLYMIHCFDSWQLFLTFAFLCIQVLVLAPIIEESVFRLPTRPAWKSTLGWIVAAIVASAVFSFAHYPDYVASVKNRALILRPLDGAFLALFFFGLAQCWLYRRTGRLWCAMLNHALFNTTNLVLLLLFPSLAGV